MKHYKICKYDYEDKNYRADWSSIWDVFDPSTSESFIPRKYLDVEKKYLNAATKFLIFFGVKNLILSSIEDNRSLETEKELSPLDYGLLGSMNSNVIELEGHKVSFMDAIYILQLSLREILWVKFVHPSGAYIAFGHDYYWLVGVADDFDIGNLTTEEGLFAYEHSDPWE